VQQCATDIDINNG